MKKKATPKGRQWVWVREKPSSAPPEVKAEVCVKAQALVDLELKPNDMKKGTCSFRCKSLRGNW